MNGAGGIKGGGGPGVVFDANAPATKPELEEAALRGAKALVKMPDADRDLVMSQVPGLVRDIAHTIVGGELDNRLLKRKRDKLEQLIEQGTNKIAAQTSAAGERVGDLKSALVEDGGIPRVIKETAKALAEIASKAGVSAADFDRLVGRLEILATLHGEKKLAMISNRELKAKIGALTNGNLAELASAVGKELAQLAYGPVRQAALSENVV